MRARAGASLTSGDLLELQRSIGNKAVAGLVLNRPDQATQDHKRVPIQRLIGFEIETGIPVNYREPSRKHGFKYKQPAHDSLNAPTGDGSKLDVDSHFGHKIFELVTVAVDDTQDPKDFQPMAKSWVNLLNKLKDKSSNSPPPKPLTNVLGGARADAYFGFPPGVGNDKNMLNRVSIQVTHGLKLKKVTKLLANLDLSKEGGSGTKTAKTNVAHNAVPTADRVMVTITTANDLDVLEPGSKRNRRVEEMRGFVSLLCNYMLLGGDAMLRGGYFKNRTPLMYKSKLSDVADKLKAGSPFAAQVLGAGYLATFQAALLTETGRTGTDPLFMGAYSDVSPTVDDWLTAILTGTGDPAFDAMKNPWSTDIKPGRVEKSKAVVLEHRNIMDESKLTNPVLNNKDGVVDYLVGLYRSNQEMQELTPKQRQNQSWLSKLF